MNWKINRADNPLRGELTVPADKSISHRAVMIGSIASGVSRIRNFLFAEDCMRTLKAFRAMGVDIETKGDNLIIRGKGLKGLKASQKELYLGNSGTTMRILSGILAGQNFDTVLTGDKSLSKRPMSRIIEPLTLMGAKIKTDKHTLYAPLKIFAQKCPLSSIDYKMPVASAQVKSCVLMAGLYAEGTTIVREPFQSRDHTERMLEYFSADITREKLRTELLGMKELISKDVTIPGDISSAAFFIVSALIVKDSCLTLSNVGLNPTRTGVLDVLKRMGADIEIRQKLESVEPRGTLEVRYSALKGTVIEENEIPLLIDEVPVIVIAAVMAHGRTVIKGIKELKFKETDRVKTLIANLKRMGITIEEKDNSLVIESSGEVKLKANKLDSYGDHRIAMSMAVAALVSDGECLIKNTACVGTSYPGFLRDLKYVLKLKKH